MATLSRDSVKPVMVFFAKKIALMGLTLFIITTATFFLVNAIPGSELDARIERMSSQKVIDRMYTQYGLDKPLVERYFITLKGMLRGDFGLSVAFEGDTIQNILKTRLPISAQLGLQQMGIGVFLGLMFGIISARTSGSWPDYLIITFAVLGISMPPIVCALLVQKFFAGRGSGLPIIGWGTFQQSILPTLAGAVRYVSFYARLMKSSMLDVMGQDYILTAESKGLRKTHIIMRHVLRNSFVPIVTYLPMSMAMCITGSFFIESVFSIPGLGYYFVNAVAKRDTPIVLGLTVFLSALYLFVVFITDILYKLIDPRIRLGEGRER